MVKKERMLLQLRNVYKGFGPKEMPAFRPVLEDLSFAVEEGARLGIVGPSGSGKTTLLNLMGALDVPDSGEVIFRGKAISGYRAGELAQFRNRELGFVFQFHHLLPQCTLWENILVPVLPLKRSASAGDKSWAEHLLRKTGIWEQRNQKPSEMSGGECQRAAVVRALINKPRLVLADEPTGALDEENARLLSELLLSLSRDEGITLVVVTHAVELAAKLDAVFHLRHGKLTP